MKRTAQRQPVSASTIVTQDGAEVQLTATYQGPAVKSAVRSKTQSTKKARQAVDDVIENADDLVKDSVGGFVDFIREHAIVGLAVGFIIGTQAQTVIKQLVTSFIEPLLKLVFGSNLATKSFQIRDASFTWGAMVYALINLFAVLIAVYALIKIFKLDQLDKPAK